MRILFVTQWFDPEPIFKGSSFVDALSAKGHDVEVATAFPNYPGGKLYPGFRLRPYQRDRIGEMVVHRLFVWPSHDKSSLGRVLNYASFFLSSLMFGLLCGGRYDLVYVYHPPITPAVAATLFCRIHGKPFVVEIQDLWPDSVAVSGMAGSRITALLDRLCGYVYRHATHLILQSDGMLAALALRGVSTAKMTRIYNWSTYLSSRNGVDMVDAGLLDSFEGRLNLVYGGNIGQAQALASVVDAVALAAVDHPEIHLHIFGNGIEREPLNQYISRHAPGLATIHPGLPRDLMDRVFDLADGLVLHLSGDPLYAITIPSKVQHYLSCGKPIIAGLSGEAAELLERSGAALVVPPRDVAGLARAIARWAGFSPAELDALGSAGRTFYSASLDFGRAIDQTDEVVTRAYASLQSSTGNKSA